MTLHVLGPYNSASSSGCYQGNDQRVSAATKCVFQQPRCAWSTTENKSGDRGVVFFNATHHIVKDTVEDAVWAVGPSFFDFTQAASYDRYGVMLAWGSRSLRW